MENNTVLKRPVSMTILSNSITLTPGTLTIDVLPEKQKLLDAVISPRSQKDVIPFEGWIKKMVED
jgi:energy-converting hydrogenase B subunit A